MGQTTCLRRDRVPLALPKGVPWLVVLLACFSLGWPDDAAAQTAATVTVCQTGATHTTIQSAVTAAAAGDRIEVCAGDFTEQVEVTKSLTIVGAGPRRRRSFSRRRRPADQDVITVDGAGVDVEISGFTIKGRALTGMRPAGRRTCSQASSFAAARTPISTTTWSPASAATRSTAARKASASALAGKPRGRRERRRSRTTRSRTIRRVASSSTA